MIASRKRTLCHCRKHLYFFLQDGITGSHSISAYSYNDSHVSVLYLGKMKYRKNEQFDHTFSFLCRHRMVRFRMRDLYNVTPVSSPSLNISPPPAHPEKLSYGSSLDKSSGKKMDVGDQKASCNLEMRQKAPQR